MQDVENYVQREFKKFKSSQSHALAMMTTSKTLTLASCLPDAAPATNGRNEATVTHIPDKTIGFILDLHH